jgi:DnaK suppressor protein
MDPDRAHELLASRRTKIEQDLAAALQPQADREDANPFEESDGSANVLDADVSEALAEPLREQLEAIARAERRLAEGTYGRSVESGEPIPDARLEAIPWAERTEEEQARYETGA